MMMGAEGIAVGLSTRVLPHNFIEVRQAEIAILQKKPFEVFPDFRQGGLMDVAEYDKGCGRVRLRAKIEQGEDNTLLIRSIPFSTTTDSLIVSIENAAKKKKLAVKSIDDFTAEQAEIRVVLKPGQNADKVIQALYAFTSCEVALASRVVVIDRDRPVELSVDGLLRRNAADLVKTLRRELESDRRKQLEQAHHKTLVQIFVEKRIYKRIEECQTLPLVQQAVLTGMNRYRDQLRRDVTQKDIEMLLGIKIKRISRYDMERNRKEIADLLASAEQIEKELEDVRAYAVRYLRGLIRKHGADYPRRTEIVTFDSIEVRELTANELTLRYDEEKGYVGHGIEGRELFKCSSLDKLLFIQADGTYRVTTPPEKLFVDREMPYCGIADRDRVFLMVYRDEDGLNYVKRFKVGGTILNREYSCAPPRTKVIYLSDQDPGKLYLKYSQPRGQQSLDLKRINVRGVKTRGSMMTAKHIDSIHAEKPKGWSDRRSSRGLLLGDS